MVETQSASNLPYVIDTHVHLDFPQFDVDRDDVVQRAKDEQVGMILMGIHWDNLQPVIDLAEQHQAKCAVGVHPNSKNQLNAPLEDKLSHYAKHDAVVAIGEIGLDYYRDYVPHAEQHELLRRQLALALELEMPVILHNRESTEDLYNILKEFPGIQGVWHSFMGTLEEAQSYLELGLYLGIGGPLTFKKNEAAREVVRQLPLDRLLIETDSPYLTPAPHRGKRNEPRFVRHVAEKLAEVKEISLEQVAEQTTQNAQKLFNF